MNIVAVDGFALNPGDLNWDIIKALGNVQVFERTNPEQIIERCKDAEVILTNKVAFNQSVIYQLPKVKLIAILATGYNIIDIDAAKQKGILVCNVPDYGSASVAQHTFAFILELATQVGLHSSSVHKGDWVACKDFSYSLTPLIEIAGKTLGLVGFGNIGQKVATIAKAFDMRVLYHTPTQKETDLAKHVSLEDLFQQSDFVSLHLPLKADKAGFVNEALLRLMKPTSFFINTARGQLVNEADLANALNEGVIAGAALDVLSVEPPKPNNPLLSAKNCILTPHNAWMSKEARLRIMDITFKNIQGLISGKPIHVVNP